MAALQHLGESPSKQLNSGHGARCNSENNRSKVPEYGVKGPDPKSWQGTFGQTYNPTPDCAVTTFINFLADGSKAQECSSL